VFDVVDSGAKEGDSVGRVCSREGHHEEEARSDGLGRGGEGMEAAMGLQACK